MNTVAQPLFSSTLRRWRTYPQRSNLRAAAVLAGVGASFSAHALDVNMASLEELQSLRGVGPRTAQMIIEERLRAGHFESLQDLSDRIRGVGSRRLLSLRAAGLVVGTSKAGVNGSMMENNMPLKGALLPTRGGAQNGPVSATPSLELVP